MDLQPLVISARWRARVLEALLRRREDSITTPEDYSAALERLSKAELAKYVSGLRKGTGLSKAAFSAAFWPDPVLFERWLGGAGVPSITASIVPRLVSGVINPARYSAYPFPGSGEIWTRKKDATFVIAAGDYSLAPAALLADYNGDAPAYFLLGTGDPGKTLYKLYAEQTKRIAMYPYYSDYATFAAVLTTALAYVRKGLQTRIHVITSDKAPLQALEDTMSRISFPGLRFGILVAEDVALRRPFALMSGPASCWVRPLLSSGDKHLQGARERFQGILDVPKERLQLFLSESAARSRDPVRALEQARAIVCQIKYPPRVRKQAYLRTIIDAPDPFAGGKVTRKVSIGTTETTDAYSASLSAINSRVSTWPGAYEEGYGYQLSALLSDSEISDAFNVTRKTLSGTKVTELEFIPGRREYVLYVVNLYLSSPSVLKMRESSVSASSSSSISSLGSPPSSVSTSGPSSEDFDFGDFDFEEGPITPH